MRISAPPLAAAACHCKGCQRLTSGPYSLTLMIPPGGFEVTEGEPVLGALHRPESQHHYCPHCKSWLFTTAPLLEGGTNFRPTMLEDASWVVPYVESNVTQKLPGVVTGAKHSFDGFPPPERYEELMAGYAREGVRPS
jgi:hypothetical protein